MAEHRNWSGNVVFSAGELVRPTTIAEVQRTVARSTGRVHALGSRHSFNRVADATDRLVDLSRLDTPIELDDQHVWCGGGTRLGDLGTFLHAAGRALHNLPSLPHLTAAGTIATATHGSGRELAALHDAVDAVELVTATGDLLVVERGDADFDGVVVALGALGVVVRLRLRTEPTYDVAQTVYDGLAIADAADHLDELLGLATSVSLFTDWRGGRIGQVWCKQRTDRPAPDRPSWFESPAAEIAHHPLPGVAADACTEQLGRPGPWHERLPHFRLDHRPSLGDELQSEYFVPFEHGADALRALADVGDRLAPILLVSEVRAVAADHQWLSPASRGPQVALHFTWRLDVPAVDRLLPILEAALEPMAPLPHWGKLSALPAATVRAGLPGAARFAELARRLDPDGRFRNAVVDTLVTDR